MGSRSSCVDCPAPPLLSSSLLRLFSLFFLYSIRRHRRAQLIEALLSKDPSLIILFLRRTDSSLSSWTSSRQAQEDQLQWEESLRQLQLIWSAVALPYAAKWMGRKWAYWGASRCWCCGTNELSSTDARGCFFGGSILVHSFLTVADGGTRQGILPRDMERLRPRHMAMTHGLSKATARETTTQYPSKDGTLQHQQACTRYPSKVGEV